MLPDSLGDLQALKTLSLIVTSPQHWELPVTLATCQQLETLTLSPPN
ncbi:MAG: hypothetical protein ACRBFS_15975 [Aureispira sp.]